MCTDIIVSPAAKQRKSGSHFRTFPSFYEAATTGYRTRRGWEERYRRVVSPAHAIVALRSGIVRGLGGCEVVQEDLGQDLYRVATDCVQVFSSEQTRPFTPRREAQQRYLEVFFSHARKDSYACLTESGWITVSAESDDRPWMKNGLTAGMVLRHANHRDTLALKSDGKTPYVVVDLDCHPKDDPELFLRRAERLLERLHGDGWHYQLRDGTISGLHFIKVFDWPWRLDKARQWMTDQLRELDEPGLDLTRLEIYPTLDGNGIRLPLAKGYLMILDEIVDSITDRKQQVGDVERYINWLDDGNRQYFPRDRLLSFLRMNLPKRPESSLINGSIILVCKKGQEPSYNKPEGHGLGLMKGCFWSKITDYWSGRCNPPGALDEAITMTARIGHKMGYEEEETVSIIKNYCRNLPQYASSRLTNPKELNRCIIKQVRGVKDNGKQAAPEKSDHILDEVVAKWKAKGLDLLNKATWNYQQPVNSGQYDFRTFEPKVAPDDLQAGMDYLVTAFPVKCQVIAAQNIERIMLAMARLAQIKHQEENGISAEYWQAFFRDQFHLELCARNIWDVLKAAIELGIIEKHARGHRGRATMYTVGVRMARYFGVLAPRDGAISLVCKKGQLPEDWEERIDQTVMAIDEQVAVLC